MKKKFFFLICVILLIACSKNTKYTNFNLDGEYYPSDSSNRSWIKFYKDSLFHISKIDFSNPNTSEDNLYLKTLFKGKYLISQDSIIILNLDNIKYKAFKILDEKSFKVINGEFGFKENDIMLSLNGTHSK